MSDAVDAFCDRHGLRPFRGGVSGGHTVDAVQALMRDVEELRRETMIGEYLAESYAPEPPAPQPRRFFGFPLESEKGCS